MEPLKNLSNLKEYELLLDKEIEKGKAKSRHRIRMRDKLQKLHYDIKEEKFRRDTNRFFPLTKDPAFSIDADIYRLNTLSKGYLYQMMIGCLYFALFFWAI